MKPKKRISIFLICLLIMSLFTGTALAQSQDATIPVYLTVTEKPYDFKLNEVINMQGITGYSDLIIDDLSVTSLEGSDTFAVTSVAATPVDPWSLVATDTDFSTLPATDNKISLSMDGHDFFTGPLALNAPLRPGKTLEKSFTGNVTPKEDPVETVTVLNIVVMVGKYMEKAAGLYNGDEFTSWDSLVSTGQVTMDGTTITDGDTSLSGELVIPYGATSIGADAFNDCTALISVTIPDSVTSISDSAFNGCSSLTDVYYTGTETEWAAIAISETLKESLTNATIHYNYNPEEEKETVLISFTIGYDETSYQAEADMSFEEYVQSEYNTGGFFIVDDAVYYTVGATKYSLMYANGDILTKNHIIQSGEKYKRIVQLV